MTNNIHVMLDLETWGKEPGCDIRSIGACVFDPMTGYVADNEAFTHNNFYIATDNPLKHDRTRFDETSPACYREYGLIRDPETVQWWNDQSDEAQAAFTNPVDLREALQRFTDWLGTVYMGMKLEGVARIGDDLRLWSHGPSFDPPILTAAYKATGLPIPWHYRAPRDTRTIMEAAGMDPHKGLEPFTTGTHHHALDDAICQARAVCAAYATIKGWQDGRPAPHPMVTLIGPALQNIIDGLNAIADELQTEQ
jgi:hypothetical protein